MKLSHSALFLSALINAGIILCAEHAMAGTNGTYYSDVEGSIDDTVYHFNGISDEVTISKKGNYSDVSNYTSIAGKYDGDSSAVSGGKITIASGTFSGETTILGGYSLGDDALENSVKIEGGNFEGKTVLKGGDAFFDANENTIEISGEVTFSGKTEVYGGLTFDVASENTVNISKGTFEGVTDIYGGFYDYDDRLGTVFDNTVEIEGGNFKNTTNIYGGGSWGGDIFSDNLIKLNGGSFAGNLSLLNANLQQTKGVVSLTGTEKTVTFDHVDLKSDISFNLMVDVSTATTGAKINKFVNTDSTGFSTYKINIDGFSFTGTTSESSFLTTVLTEDADIKGAVTLGSNTLYTIGEYSYTVAYSKETGKFTFTKNVAPEPPPTPEPENKFAEETAKSGGSSSDIQAALAIDGAVKEGAFDEDIYNKMLAKGGDAVKDVKPTETQLHSQTTMNLSAMINNVVVNHLEAHLMGRGASRFSGKNAGDNGLSGAIWGKVIYNHSKQSSSSHNDGFKSDTFGFVMGADAEVTDNLILGLGYAYDRTDISSGDKDTDVKSHTVFVYGKYNFTKNWFVRGNAGYNFANYEEKVSYLGGKIADYDVNSILANADIGYAMENGFTPTVGVRYAYMDQDNYTDKTGQHVTSKGVQVLRGVVGVDYAKEVNTNGFKWTPKAGVGVSYDIKNTDSVAVVNVGSSSYRTKSERLKREALEARVGATTSYKNWDFSIDYELNLREKFESHTGTIKVVYKF